MQHFRRRTKPVRSLIAHRSASARLAAAIVSTSLFTADTLAQTWISPNSGSWSVAANWAGGVVPTSSATTTLRFNGFNNSDITAFNDVANPFLLNTLELNRSPSIGRLLLDGGILEFAGTSPTINLINNCVTTFRAPVRLDSDTSLTSSVGGGGSVQFQNAITSAAVPTGTTGASLVVNSSDVATEISSGGSLYGLRASRGLSIVNGGVLTLTSTQHGNDPFGGASDAGRWSVVVGDAAGALGKLNVFNATLSAQNCFVANAPGSLGELNFFGAATSANFTSSGTEGRFGVNFGTGTIGIGTGATVTARRADLGRQAGSNAFLSVAGANARLSLAQSFNLPAGNATATASVSEGGVVEVTGGQAFIAGATDGLNNSVASTASMTITGANSALNVGSLGGGNNGQLSVGIGSTSVAAAGTLNITAGGSATARNTFVGRGLGVGTVLIDGASSRLVSSNQIAVSSATATPSSLTVSNGATLSSGNTLFVGVGTLDTGIVSISGPGSLATITSATVLGGGNGIGSFGGSATLNIASGGELRTDFMQAAENPNGRAFVTVDGANSKLTLTDQLVIGDDVGTSATFTVSNGATASVASGAFLSPAIGAQSTFTVTGAGSSFASSSSLNELQIGGAFGVAGGTATFSVLDNASANAGRVAVVYLRGALNVGGGTTPASFTAGTAGLIVDGVARYNSGTLSTTGTLAVGGSVLLSSAGAGRTNKKTLDVGTVSLTASGIVDLNDNDMISRGSSRTAVQNYVNAARHNGAWDLPGITSSAARDNPAHNTTLGVLSGAEYSSMNAGTTQFNGRSFAGSDTLVKYTYYGDTDFNGRVNFDDYVRIDNGFNNHLTGWMNGDFDGNGQVNFDDYVLIDLAFNSQGAVLTRGSQERASTTRLVERSIIESVLGQSVAEEKRLIAHAQLMGGDASIGGNEAASAVTRSSSTRAVPEPVSLGVFGVGLLVGACAPRERRRNRGGRSRRARCATGTCT